MSRLTPTSRPLLAGELEVVEDVARLIEVSAVRHEFLEQEKVLVLEPKSGRTFLAGADRATQAGWQAEVREPLSTDFFEELADDSRRRVRRVGSLRVNPGTETESRDDGDRGYAARDRRFWAAVVDLWFVPFVLSILVSVGSLAGRPFPGVLDGQAVAWLLTVVVLVGSEAIFAQSPGKKLLGLRVVKLDGSTPGWRQALLRRSWLLPVVFELVPGFPDWIGFWLFAAIVITLLVSIRRSPDNRGWHDRLAGTDVVPWGSWARGMSDAQGSEEEPDLPPRGGGSHGADGARGDY